MIPLCLVLHLASGGVYAQAQSDSPGDDHQTIQVLLQRIQELESKVKVLEAQRSDSSQSVPSEIKPETAAALGQAQRPSPADAASDSMSMATRDERALNPHLNMRGFADVGFFSNRNGAAPFDHSAFALGQFNLFITSRLSERASMLSEVVIEADPSNEVGVDLERLLFNYDVNDYLQFSVGRYHTAIGYYNTAYHHSSWMQTGSRPTFSFRVRR
jgi:hypothetical protein